MVELGMEPSHVDTLARALFGSVNQPMEEVDDDDDLVLEDQAEPADPEAAAEEESDDELALEENPSEAAAAAVPPPPAAAPAVSDANKRAAERVKAQGNDALKAGRLKDAATLYGQALALNPTEAVYYSNRSSVLISLQQHDAALRDAHECVRLRPEWAKSHLRVGAALSEMKRHAEAAVAYGKALRLEPSNRQIAALEEAAKIEAESAENQFDWLQVGCCRQAAAAGCCGCCGLAAAAGCCGWLLAGCSLAARCCSLLLSAARCCSLLLTAARCGSCPNASDGPCCRRLPSAARRSSRSVYLRMTFMSEGCSCRMTRR
jgi:tetratricopeptide (TPR) repeat protein